MQLRYSVIVSHTQPFLTDVSGVDLHDVLIHISFKKTHLDERPRNTNAPPENNINSTRLAVLPKTPFKRSQTHTRRIKNKHKRTHLRTIVGLKVSRIEVKGVCRTASGELAPVSRRYQVKPYWPKLPQMKTFSNKSFNTIKLCLAHI